ncbi:Ig-like domain-containing protein, partial [Dokdonia ponticola]
MKKSYKTTFGTYHKEFLKVWGSFLDIFSMKIHYLRLRKESFLNQHGSNPLFIKNAVVAPELRMCKKMIFSAIAMMFLFSFSVEAQTQSPSITSGVTFQWSDVQDTNNNGDIDFNENNNPATIQSITVGSEVYNTFVVPSGYQLTRLGPSGHNPNGIILNGSQLIGTSSTATLPINDSNAWDNAALSAFQDKNLNHYFTSNPNGANICLNFPATQTTNAQKQTLFYDPAIPSNADAILAVTERGGNNCFYIEMWGTPAGGGPDQKLGETFVRTSGDLRNGGFSPPASGSDYWGSGREQDNSQTIAIALFELNNIAPTGSKISRVEFVAASNDHGDGKLFILQTYAVDSQQVGCLDSSFSGNIDLENNVPENSTYSLVSGPTPAGQSFTLNPDGTYTYMPSPGFLGDVTFEYQVCLPAPNTNVCDTATVTLTFVELPDMPTIDLNCNDNGLTDIVVTAPIGPEFEYSINGGTYQSSPTFTGLSEGTYQIKVRNSFSGCENTNATAVVIDDLDIVIPIDVTDVLCKDDTSGEINITVTGGKPPYTYSWSNGATTQDLTDLAAGTYTIIVTDDYGCTITRDVIVTEPQSTLITSGDVTDALCNGDDSGAIDFTANGGTPPYTYAWSNGETTEDLSDVVAGNYTVTVTDANGCTESDSFVVNQPGNSVQISIQPIAVLCFGEESGRIELTVTGSSPPYSFEWSNGATTEDLIDIAAGSYSVIVRNACGAIVGNGAATVGQPAAITADKEITDVTCFGEDTGSIDITVDGGTPPFTFDWSNGETTEDIIDVVAGAYSVLVTDANGCTITVNATVMQPNSALSASGTAVDVLCNGDDTGAIDFTVNGGTPPYTYVWSNGETTEDLSDVVAGNYSVVATDANGCTISDSFIIDEPDNALSVNITRVDATTAQGCLNGEATATVTGGTPPYTYEWSASAGGQTTQTATNLPGNFNGNGAGVHSVTITDANGCELVQSVIINCSDTCDAVIAIQNTTDVLCAGENTGSATVSGSSNANPAALFTFTWNTGQVDAGVTSSTLSNLTAGVYTVSVTIDGTVCLAVEQSVTITEPTSPVGVSISSTDETGPGLNNGTATANPTGGVPPYTYVWSNGEMTQTITGLAPNTYTVTVTDANGCEAMNTVTVNEGSCQNLAITTSATNVSCNGFSDGTASSNTTGGVGPFTYSWSNGATTEDITGLVAGMYTVTVTDGFTNCTAQSTVTVNEPSVLSGGIAVNNVLCHAGDTGSLNLTVSGGTFPYTFDWSNGETTEDIIDVVAGAYSVLVTDANGCTITVNATVMQPNSALSASGTAVDVLCNGDDTGAIDFTVNGGTPPYTYAWSNGETTEDLSDVVAGNYSVVATDANGCTISNSFTVGEPDSALGINITKINATTAQGCLDGEATATVTGGTPPYTYLWSASAGSQTTATATNLSDEAHSVTVTDANGCMLTQSVVIDCINTCDAVISIQDVTDVLCAGENTGSTTVSASSNANAGALFTFTWNTGQVDAGVTASTLSNLSAGVYTVSVTIDGTVCLAVEQSVTITEPTSPVGVSISSTDETGPGLNNGTATANPTGGVPPYTYVWSNGEMTQTITGLSPNTYNVTVTDANGCEAMNTVTVNQGSCQNLAITTSATNVSCNGFSDGTASSNTTGGVGPFTYSWSNGATTEDITGLVAGTYTVTVTDGFTNCTAQSTVTVNEPSVLSGGIAVNNVLCHAEDTGSLNLTVSGGTFPYTFDWSNGETTEDIIDVVAGAYSVLVTDANGCTITVNATVMQPNTPVTGDVTTTNENGATADDGTATVVASGGTPPYTYLWSNGETTPMITDLDSGDYTITVTDANGCTYVETVTVNSSNQIPDAEDDTTTTQEDTPVNIDVTNDDDFGTDGPSTGTIVIISGPSNGTATVNDNNTPDDPTDDTIDYTPSPDFNGEDELVYQIEDSNGDTSTATVTITVTPADDVMDDTATTPEDTPVDIAVLDNDGFDPDSDVEVTDVTDPANGTVTINPDGTVTYTPDPDFNGTDTFDYTVTVTNPDGSTTTETATVVVTVTPVEDIMDDTATTPEDTPVDIAVLDNDGFDPDSDVEVTDVTDPANGTVTINPD